MWTIYYPDGTTINSNAATPSSITRRTGIQVIIQEDAEKGWLALPPYDYYMWDDRGNGAKWFPGDQVGFFQYITHIDASIFL